MHRVACRINAESRSQVKSARQNPDIDASAQARGQAKISKDLKLWSQTHRHGLTYGALLGLELVARPQNITTSILWLDLEPMAHPIHCFSLEKAEVLSIDNAAAQFNLKASG